MKFINKNAIQLQTHMDKFLRDNVTKEEISSAS